MTKATNKGTCQCCGAVQKLPNGKLSKHGYTVDWGFFNGVCSGAGHAPYEESKDLIEDFILSAEASLTATLVEIEETKELSDSISVWKHSYSRWRGYFWEKRELAVEREYVSHYVEDGEDPTRRIFEWVYGADEEKPRGRLTGIGGDANTLEEAAQNENMKYIKSVLDKRVVGLKSYIEWQKGRAASWEKKDLLPL